MGVSIEILVSKTKTVSLDTHELSFKALLSQPPQSHRGSASLWQRDFERDGGALVHIGDPEMQTDRGVFWAYNILEDIEWQRFRLLPKYKRSFFSLLRLLLRQSQLGRLVLTSDAQLGPKPLKYSRPYSLTDLESVHNRQGLRLNSLMEIKCD